MTKILGKEKPQQRIYVLNIVINFQIASSLKINAPANSRRNS